MPATTGMTTASIATNEPIWIAVVVSLDHRTACRIAFADE
jgi:hypothetical protein